MLEAESVAPTSAHRYGDIFWSVGITEVGLVCGAGSVLARMTGSDQSRHLALDADRERLMAMLSIIAGKPISAATVLHHVDASALHWRRGDKALANLRLVFSSLPRLADREAVDRLALTEKILDSGLSPTALMKALWPDMSSALALNYNPAQARVPAGHGAESGQWTPRLQTESSRSEVDAQSIRVSENDDARIVDQGIIPRHDEVVHDASAADPPKHHSLAPILDPFTQLPTGIGPGPFTYRSVPAGPGRRPTPFQQKKVDEIGRETGCHTCGNTNPGTPTGRFRCDHQPPSALCNEDTEQRFLPHCADCSNSQGGKIKALMRRGWEIR